MKYILSLLLISQVFAQETDEERLARERILNQYGNKQQVEAVEAKHNKSAYEKALESDGSEFDQEKEKFTDLNEHINFIRSKPLVTENELKSLTPEQVKDLKTRRQKLRKDQISLLQEQIKANQKTIFDSMEEDEGIYVRNEEGMLVKATEEEVLGENAGTNEAADVKEQLSSFYAEKGIDDNFLSNMIDEKMKAEMAKLMKSNPLSQMPKSELAAKIEENSKGTPVGKFLMKNPKMKEAMVELAHDKDALPGLISIINKPEVLKKYGICVFVIMVAAFIINLLNTKGSLIKRIFTKLALGAGTFICNIGAFYFLFQKEVDPAVSVLKRVFL